MKIAKEWAVILDAYVIVILDKGGNVQLLTINEVKNEIFKKL